MKLDPHTLELIGVYLDGDPTASQVAELAAWVRADAAHAAAFIEQARTARQIGEQFAAASRWRIKPVEAAPAPPSRAIPARSGAAIRWAIAAAIAVAGVAVMIVASMSGGGDGRTEPAPVAVASLVSSTDVRWNSQPMQLGDTVMTGDLSIASGRLVLLMDSGATMTLLGPVEVSLTGRNSARLRLGTLHAEVPQSAVGFAVAAPNETRVVDLGTEFAMRVEPGGRTNVYVIRGEVALHSGSTMRIMQADDGLAVVRTGAIVDDTDAARHFASLDLRGPSVDRPSYRYLEGLGSVTADASVRDEQVNRLTDDVIGASPWNTGTWVAYGDHTQTFPEVAKPAIEFDLGEEIPVYTIDIVYGVNHLPGGFHAPDRVLVSFSEDGERYTDPVEFDGFNDAPDAGGIYQIDTRTARIQLKDRWARYVRLSFYNDGLWTGLSEVRFNSDDDDDDRAHALEPRHDDTAE